MAWKNGDVIGCAADLELGELWFGVNGERAAAISGCSPKWAAGLFPAMSGKSMGVAVHSTPRFAGPATDFLHVGSFPPQLLDENYDGKIVLGRQA